MTTCTDTTKCERWLSMRGRWVDDSHFKKYCPNTLCCLECERRRTDFPYDGGVGWGGRAIFKLPPPQAECASGRSCRDYKQNSHHANQARCSPGPARGRRHTPGPARARVLHPPRPRPPGVPAGTPSPTAPARTAPAPRGRCGGRAAAGRREGHVPSQPRRTPFAHRPPSLRRPLRGLPESVSAPAEGAPVPRLSGPASSGSPPLPRARARARRPSRLPSARPAPPEPGAQGVGVI